MAYSGIYKITSPTGKVYIGQTKNISKRWSAHRAGSRGCAKLYRSISKHGAEAHIFNLIHEIPIDSEQTVFNNYEDLYMNLYKDCGIELMNLKGDMVLGKHSQETKERFKKVFTGRKLTQEHKDKIGNSHRGKKRKEGTGEKISAALLGNKRSAETKAKQRALKLGKPLSDEHKKALSIALSGSKNPFFGKRHPPETLARISATKKLNKCIE
jgi:group I intron endonuclease